VASKPETIDKIVNLNEIVTFSSNKILSDPTRSITEAEVFRTGAEVVKKVLGEGVTYSQFSESDFVAKIDSTEVQPGLYDVILDGINETASTESISSQDLIQQRYYSTDKCVVPLLEDESFTVSFAGNLLEAGYKTNALIETISPVYNTSAGREMVTSLTVALDNFVTNLEKEQHKVVKIPMASLRKTVCKVMDDYLNKIGGCRIRDLGSTALNQLFDNVLSILKDAVIQVAEDVESTIKNEEMADAVIDNSLRQTASAAVQLKLTDTLSSTVIEQASQTAQEISTATAAIFKKTLESTSAQSVTSLFSSVDTNVIATTTMKYTQELVSLPVLAGSTNSFSITTNDFVPVLVDSEDKQAESTRYSQKLCLNKKWA
jgi:DNA-binding protein Fis